jgi:hypothetical protein
MMPRTFNFEKLNVMSLMGCTTFCQRTLRTIRTSWTSWTSGIHSERRGLEQTKKVS